MESIEEKRPSEVSNSLNPIKILLLLILMCGIILTILLFKNPLSKPSTYIDLSRDSVVKEMQSLGRLETAAFSIEKIVEAGIEGNVLQDLLYGDRILLIANGKVLAGVDLTTLSSEDVEVDGKNLTVNLPAPFIFSSSLDSSKTKVYDRSQGLLSQGDKDLETEARKSAEQSIREAACGSGILEEARKNAIERVKQLFEFAGFETVTVNIPSGSC